MKLDFMAILKKDSAKRKFCQKSIVFCLGTPKPLFTFAWKSRQNKLLLRRPTITKKPFFRYLSEVYDGCRYGWTLARHATEWYHDMRPPIRKCLSYIHTTVTSTWFEYTICKFRSIRDILRVFCRHVVSRFFLESTSLHDFLFCRFGRFDQWCCLDRSDQFDELAVGQCFIHLRALGLLLFCCS